LLLLAVPACGLSDYEALMRDAQEREKRFHDEQKYLDKPVTMPTRKVKKDKDKEEREKPVGNVFFRPPRGIDSNAKSEPRDNLIWQYPARSNGNDFIWVALAFGDDEKDFADKVVKSYQPEPPNPSSLQLTPPGQETPMLFDTWDFSSGDYGYSINVLRGSRPIAVVYIYNKVRYETVRKAIEISLQSLAVDPQQVGAARQRYNRPTPWKLEGKSGS